MEKEPKFSMERFLTMGLEKNRFFRLEPQLKPRLGYTVLLCFKIKWGVTRAPHYFFIPDRHLHILFKVHSEPNLYTIRRRDILRLRKNNRIKSTYLKMRKNLKQDADDRRRGQIL